MRRILKEVAPISDDRILNEILSPLYRHHHSFLQSTHFPLPLPLNQIVLDLSRQDKLLHDHPYHPASPSINKLNQDITLDSHSKENKHEEV
jgi:hypothetical protein